MTKIEIITADELKKMRGSEGLVLQGCGGDLDEWVDGINDILTKEGILLEDTKFDKAMAFKHEGLTNLLFPFTEDVKLNIGKFALWRIASHETFGGTWLTDYVDNRLGGFEMSEFEKQTNELNSFHDVEATFDFQCDQTGGYPTCLVWNRAECKAWLSPSEHKGENKEDYLDARLEDEMNPKIRDLLERDKQFLDEIQVQMSTSREFMFAVRLRNESDEQSFATLNRIEKSINEQGFDCNRAEKDDVKHVLSRYFGINTDEKQLDDNDGDSAMQKWIIPD